MNVVVGPSSRLLGSFAPTRNLDLDWTREESRLKGKWKSGMEGCKQAAVSFSASASGTKPQSRGRTVRAGQGRAGAVGVIGVQGRCAAGVFSDWSGSLRKAAVEKAHPRFGGAAARVGV